MNNQLNPAEHRYGVAAQQTLQADRISFLADKFGVSRQTVLIVMSIAGPDDLLIEKILRQNRFTR